MKCELVVYILGEKEFWGWILLVNVFVLIFWLDIEMIIENIFDFLGSG